jgi:hypothetical protein
MQDISSIGFQRMMNEQHISPKDLRITDDLTLNYNRFFHSIENCEFQSIQIDTSVNSVVMVNCKAKSLTIKAASIQKIEIVNCEILTLNVDSHAIETNKNRISLEIKGERAKTESVTVTGYFRSINFEDIKKIDHVKFSSGEAQDINIRRVQSTLFTFEQMQVHKPSLVINNNETSFDFHDSFFDEITFILSTNISIELSSIKSNFISFLEGSYKNINFIGIGEYDLKIGQQKTTTTVNLISFNDFFLKDKSRIKLIDTSVNELMINNFENNGMFSMSNCNFQNSLNFFDSNLGKAVFNNIDARNTKTLFTNCNLLDIIFTNFRWPNGYHFHYDEKNTILLVPLRESYRQLKVNYQKSGNKIESLEFQKKEMEVHYEYLKLHSFKKPSWSNVGNFLIVGTNKWSSDFGQNIWKPLLLLFIFHLIFFNLILSYHPELGITFNYFNYIDKHASYTATKLFFQTLLPIHTTELKIDQDHIVSIGGFLDFMMRISSGYFIYYFVSASRKYHP